MIDFTERQNQNTTRMVEIQCLKINQLAVVGIHSIFYPLFSLIYRRSDAD